MSVYETVYVTFSVLGTTKNKMQTRTVHTFFTLLYKCLVELVLD